MAAWRLANPEHRNISRIGPALCEHPDRKRFSKGLCSSCYFAAHVPGGRRYERRTSRRGQRMEHACRRCGRPAGFTKTSYGKARPGQDYWRARTFCIDCYGAPRERPCTRCGALAGFTTGRRPRKRCESCAHPPDLSCKYCKQPAGRSAGERRRVCSACHGTQNYRRFRKDHCERCGWKPPTPKALDVDHVVPRYLGGTNDPSNLQTLCPNCHRLKSLAERGLLPESERVA